MYETIIWIHVIIHLSKPTEYMTVRVNPNVNYSKLQSLVMGQRMFIDCNKCPTLVEDVDNGGGYASVGIGGRWETSVPSSQFSCEP